MKRIKSKNTTTEIAVRSLLHRMGYRFRLHRKDLPGTPDIVFPGRQVVVFVHGCFWNGHGCGIGQLPKSRLEYWEPKINANRQRDAGKEKQLRLLGWSVVVVWQCELRDVERLSKRLEKLLGPKRE